METVGLRRTWPRLPLAGVGYGTLFKACWSPVEMLRLLRPSFPCGLGTRGRNVVQGDCDPVPASALCSIELGVGGLDNAARVEAVSGLCEDCDTDTDCDFESPGVPGDAERFSGLSESLGQADDTIAHRTKIRDIKVVCVAGKLMVLPLFCYLPG